MTERPPIEYESPGARDAQRRGRSQWHPHVAGQLLFAICVVLGAVIVCAIGGGLLAKIISVLFPSYYPTVFPKVVGDEAIADGIATGVGQGAAAGVFVGAMIVLSLAIVNGRIRKTRESD